MASKVLTKKDYIRTSLRAYYIQNGFNYGNYQGLGYANMLYPALRKIYKDDDDAFQAALKENVEFYNTNPHFVPFITSLHLAMLENGTPNSEIRNIKMALMGPLSGIGDSLSQFVLAPLLGTIGASMAYEGLMLGPIIYLLGMNLILLAIKIVSGMLGYNLGTSIIGTMTEQIEKVSRVASMIGVTVISGLAVSFVKINTSIQYAVAVPGGEEKLITLQSMLDAIAPRLLPCAFVGLVFYLIKVKKWTTVKLVCMTIALGIVLSVLGILA